VERISLISIHIDSTAAGLEDIDDIYDAVIQQQAQEKKRRKYLRAASHRHKARANNNNIEAPTRLERKGEISSHTLHPGSRLSMNRIRKMYSPSSVATTKAAATATYSNEKLFSGERLNK
jgi:tRNA A37 N6-isopentenylltransferase MiaA